MLFVLYALPKKLHVRICVETFWIRTNRFGIKHWHNYLLENEGIQLRRNEKKILNDINADKDGRLRFHILGDKGKKKKRIQTREEKIFILANDCLTGDPSVHELSLIQVSIVTSVFFCYRSIYLCLGDSINSCFRT